MKKIILMVCGGLLIVGVALGGIFQYYIKPKYVAPLVIAVEEFLLEDTETVDLLLQEYEESLIEEVTLGEETEQNKPQETYNTDHEIIKDEAAKNDEKVDAQKENVQESAEEKNKKPQKKIVAGGKTMTELQKEIEPSDLKAGLKIASKIDTAHLLNLASGGFTVENKKKAKAHLQSRLTSSEYSQLKGFVGKYAYLLK